MGPLETKLRRTVSTFKQSYRGSTEYTLYIDVISESTGFIANLALIGNSIAILECKSDSSISAELAREKVASVALSSMVDDFLMEGVEKTEAYYKRMKS